MEPLKVNWLSACPRCNHEGPHNVETNSANPDLLNEGDVVTCGQCNQGGVIELVEAGIVECYWAEDDGYYCQCDNPDCGNWFTVSEVGATCQECNKGSMQPQDVEPY